MDRKRAEAKAHELVEKMTISEAASQLVFNSPAIERLGVKAYNWWNETLHGIARGGTATMFPQAIAMAASFDPDLVLKEAQVCAEEARAKYNAAVASEDRDMYKGLNFWTPNVNIFRDPRWGRGQETFGEDPVLTSLMGAAFVKGLQGSGDVMKAAACAKHFAAHSGPESLRHSFDAIVSEKDMAETYLPAFKALVDSGVEAVMGAYNKVNGEPCCAHEALMVETLRGEWGFKGHFVSDCWAIRDFHEHHHVTSRPEESVALALGKGCDLNCGCTYQYVMNAYDEGLISEKLIRQSAERLFTARYLLGIMEGSDFDSIPFSVVEAPEHLELARKAAAESCVLLKNNGMLPLDLSAIKTLGVIGPDADSRLALQGNYHGTSSHYVTILEGLQQALEDRVRILFSEGSHLYKDSVEPLTQPDDRISEAVAVARASDAVILVVGLDETLEGEETESGDKEDLLLPACQRRLMDAVLSVGKPTAIVLMAGSSIDLGPAVDKADALLLAWYPGALGGKAVADIIRGAVSPSGKLPVTFYHNSDLKEMPDFKDYGMKGRTYRYLEREPLFPFGYGLAYSRVRVKEASVESVSPDDGFDVVATACNEGDCDTDEVVQVYVQNEGSLNAPPNPRLAAFQRVFCPAGETVQVSIRVDSGRIKVVDSKGAFVDEGRAVFYVGIGQCDELTERLTGVRSIRCEVE